MTNKTPGQAYKQVVDQCRKAAESGGEWLGVYMTPRGPVDLYVTTQVPKNISEHCDTLRIPPPGAL